MPAIRVTEVKTIKIVSGDKCNPVFVTWLNTPGGRENWLFYKVQTEGITTSTIADFEQNIDDIETSRGQINDIEINATPHLIVHALVDVEDIRGLKTLLYSINVEMLMNPSTWTVDGPKWQTVRPQKGSFAILDTDEVQSLIEITFDLNYINVQTQ